MQIFHSSVLPVMPLLPPTPPPRPMPPIPGLQNSDVTHTSSPTTTNSFPKRPLPCCEGCLSHAENLKTDEYGRWCEACWTEYYSQPGRVAPPQTQSQTPSSSSSSSSSVQSQPKVISNVSSGRASRPRCLRRRRRVLVTGGWPKLRGREGVIVAVAANQVGRDSLSAQRPRHVEVEVLLNPRPRRPSPWNVSSTQGGDHSKGYHCVKSGCLKKYCECIQAEIACSHNCECVDCQNTGDSSRGLVLESAFRCRNAGRSTSAFLVGPSRYIQNIGEHIMATKNKSGSAQTAAGQRSPTSRTCTYIHTSAPFILHAYTVLMTCMRSQQALHSTSAFGSLWPT